MKSVDCNRQIKSNVSEAGSCPVVTQDVHNKPVSRASLCLSAFAFNLFRILKLNWININP